MLMSFKFYFRSAAWGGHVTTVDVLLKRGADVERADAEGRTALRAAAWGTLKFEFCDQIFKIGNFHRWP